MQDLIGSAIRSLRPVLQERDQESIFDPVYQCVGFATIEPLV